jgi:hypothetical protein
MILVGYWAADAAGPPVKALEETAEADAYATSLQQASEIAANAARRPELELVKWAALQMRPGSPISPPSLLKSTRRQSS